MPWVMVSEPEGLATGVALGESHSKPKRTNASGQALDNSGRAHLAARSTLHALLVLERLRIQADPVARRDDQSDAHLDAVLEQRVLQARSAAALHRGRGVGDARDHAGRHRDRDEVAVDEEALVGLDLPL